jgi:hypothetical protein
MGQPENTFTRGMVAGRGCRYPGRDYCGRRLVGRTRYIGAGGPPDRGHPKSLTTGDEANRAP